MHNLKLLLYFYFLYFYYYIFIIIFLLLYFIVFDQDKGKFEADSNRGVFLEFDFRTHCYIIMDYKNLKIYLVREAAFDEDQPTQLVLNNNKLTDNLYSLTIKLFSNDIDNTKKLNQT